MSPVSPPATAPVVRQYVSQIDGVRPSSATAPSIWYAEVATPNRKSRPKRSINSRSVDAADAVSMSATGSPRSMLPTVMSGPLPRGGVCRCAPDRGEEAPIGDTGGSALPPRGAGCTGWSPTPGRRGSQPAGRRRITELPVPQGRSALGLELQDDEGDVRRVRRRVHVLVVLVDPTVVLLGVVLVPAGRVHHRHDRDLLGHHLGERLDGLLALLVGAGLGVVGQSLGRLRIA